MTDWFTRTLLPLLLMAVLAIGGALPLAKAGDMGCMMGAAAAMDLSGPMDAQGQPHGACGDPEGKMQALACAMSCMIPAPALLPQTVPIRLAEVALPALPVLPLLAGILPAPDPHPPRAARPA